MRAWASPRAAPPLTNLVHRCGCDSTIADAGVCERKHSHSARSEEVYRIATGDILDVNVFRQPDLSRTVDVDGAGQILLPLIGAMPAAGKTVRELEAEITRLLGAKYLQSPQVSVALKDAVGQRVTVEGAVRGPGVRQARGQTTLLRVLAELGGFTDTADQTQRHGVSPDRAGQGCDAL